MRAVTALLLAAMAVPAAAEPNDYDICLDLVASDPARAEAEAAHWAEFTGSPAARHCHALALVALGAERRGARALADLGVEAGELPAEVRAAMLTHAAELWLGMGEAEAGLAAMEQSLRLVNDAAAHTLRARLLAETGAWSRALGALDQALGLAPPTAERAALRAGAKRHLGRLTDARADALWAVELDPAEPLAHLELGAAEAAMGRQTAARKALLAAIEADPQGPESAIARARLQALETGG